MTVPFERQEHQARDRRIDLIVTAFGIAFVAGAIAANQSWLDRHFLPSFFVPRDWYVRAETAVRVAIIAVGVLLMRVGPLVGRLIGRTPGRAASAAIAAMLALGVGELVLQRVRPGSLGWLVANDEPRRQIDARLGWVLTPARLGRAAVAGHTIEYAIDANGERVRRLDEPVDRTRPTIVFVGESVMFGDGLAWDETIPAQVGRMSRVQTANLAVHGYSTDQAYLRMERDLPSFRQPIAVVAIFMTTLFGRNLDDDRPHIGPGLAWVPAERPSRLMSLVGLVVPYRTDKTVEDGVRTTRDVLQAGVALARARGAAPLVVVPQIGEESGPEQRLRRRVFDGSGVPYVLVEIDREWHLPWDRHPDARAAQLIAGAIVDKLQLK
jgi:hypothetical protein